MNDIYILAVVIVACCAWVRYSLKKQIEELDKSRGQALSPAPAVAAPVDTVVTQPSPAITINSALPYNDEIAAVITAAVKAYESEADTPAAALTVSCEPAEVQLAPALTVRRYSRRNSMWVATARYESHKRL